LEMGVGPRSSSDWNVSRSDSTAEVRAAIDLRWDDDATGGIDRGGMRGGGANRVGGPAGTPA